MAIVGVTAAVAVEADGWPPAVECLFAFFISCICGVSMGGRKDGWLAGWMDVVIAAALGLVF